MLKEKLLLLGIFEDNEYLNKYVELIETNLETKREKFKTQKHHIIPLCFFKQRNIEVDSSKENIVNLLFKDHCLAHYYLALCSRNDKFKYANIVAIRHIIGNCAFVASKSYKKDAEFIKDLENFQYLYEESKKLFGKLSKEKNVGKVRTEEQKIKYSKSKLGIPKSQESIKKMIETVTRLEFVWLYFEQENKEIRVKKKETSQYLSQGWKLGRRPFSLNIKDKLSKSLSNRVLSKETKEKMSISKRGHTGYNKGKTRTEDSRRKTKQSMLGKNKGKIYINKGSIQKTIQKGELELYNSMGWSIGSITHHNHQSGRVIINNGEIEKRVFADDYKINYNTEIWKRGRLCKKQI